MGKIYIRIDDRLVHGQITTNWISYLDITKIIVIDDKTASNKMLMSIMSMSIPKNIQFEVYKFSDFTKLDKSKENILIIVKYPSAIEDVLQKESDVESIFVGTVVNKDGAKKINKNIYLTEDDERNLTTAKDYCPVYLQQLPDSSKTKW